MKKRHGRGAVKRSEREMELQQVLSQLTRPVQQAQAKMRESRPPIRQVSAERKIWKYR